MLHWIVDWIGRMSYGAVALLMAIENVFLPLPSELIMPLAGFQTARGRMSLLGVIVAGTIGGVAGSFPFYFIARKLGQDRFLHAVDSSGKWFFLRRGDVQSARLRFDRWGGWAVFLSQLLPGLRGLIAIPAGLARMSFPLYTLANLMGTAIWCTVLAFLGRLLRSQFTRVHDALGPVGWGLLGLTAVALLVWWLRRRHREAHGRA